MTPRYCAATVLATGLALICSGAISTAAIAAAADARSDAVPARPRTTTPRQRGCLSAGDGYLRARLRGALDLDVNWRDAEIDCSGGARPDGSGMRVSVAGPVQSDGRRLRFVFGIGQAREGTPGRALPTNLTVIFEGEKRIFATRGEGKCTVDELVQQRVGALDGEERTWRVVARGFCTSPATNLASDARLLVTSFDFAAKVTFEEPHDAPPAKEI